MSYKILTKNGIDNTNIDGARGEYFNSGMRDGIVQGVLNEGTFIASSSNVISLDTCELRIAGHRIVIDEPVYHTFSNAPSTDTRYAFIAQIIVDANQNVDFSLFVQSADTPLIQNDLYKTINGSGTYQVEIGKFTLTTSLSIEDVIRTIDVITGGTGKGSGSTINIGNVTTQTLDPDVDAEVDVSERYEEDEGKEYLDFYFGIPSGSGASGITELIGTEDDPINLYTDMEQGKLYSCSGYVYRGSTRITEISNDNNLLCFVLSHGSTSARIIFFDTKLTVFNKFANYQGGTQEISVDNTGSFNTTPYYYSVQFINGDDDVNSFYAPTTSGEAGQVLQSNGADQAPSWNSLSTTISESSTDSEIPSALSVYNLIQNSIVSALGGNY